MTTQLNYIDDYFSGILSKEEKQLFEEKIQSDPVFADEVAFYLSSMAVSREDADEVKKQRFRELYSIRDEETTARVVKFRWLRPAMSAAAVLLVVLLAWTLFLKPPSVTQIADRYIKTELNSFGSTMGKVNNMEEVKGLYNNGKYAEAMAKLTDMLKEKQDDAEAIKIAGIVSLRMENYDQALGYFKWLAEQKGYYDNPGEFYQALTLMKRNLPGDKQKAKTLLQDVVKQNLTGKETAQDWLKDL
jgi:tetratricopeptide (TPR) repeat protein